MSGSQKLSLCSAGAAVDFYMRGCVDGDHISAAVDALMQVLHDAGLSMSVYVETVVEERFRHRLELATEGNLTPSDHVKSI